MMPVPCVRIEFATWRMLIVFRNLLSEDFSTKIYMHHHAKLKTEVSTITKSKHLIVHVVEIIAHKYVDSAHNFKNIEPLQHVR